MNPELLNSPSPGGLVGQEPNPMEFTCLLGSSRSRIFGHLLALVQNLADAEDLYQQTALLLWEKFDQYQRGTDFGAWAVTVAHYQALNFLRRQSRRKSLFSDAASARRADRYRQATKASRGAPAADANWQKFGLSANNLSELKSDPGSGNSVFNLTSIPSVTLGRFRFLSRAGLA